MADIELGSIVARLKGDTGDFARQMQQATVLLQQVVTALGQLRQADTSTQQSTKQLSAEFGALAGAIKEQTAAYTQSAAAALAYKKEQDALAAALRKQQEEQRQATAETHRGADAWKQMLSVAAGVGIGTGIASLTADLKDFVVSIVTTGAKIEQLKASLGAIAGDARAGGTQFQFLIDTSQRLGFDVIKLAEGFRQFAGATRGTALAGEETRKIFTGMTEAARAMGSSSEQTGRGLLALGQIVSKGVVSMEELRQQLAEAIPGSFAIAARAIGVTAEELNKMVSDGEVRAIPFVRALGRQLHEEFGPLAAGAADTAKAAFARFGNEILLLKNTWAESGLLEGVVKLTAAFANYFRLTRENAEARKLQVETEADADLIGKGVRARDFTGQQARQRAELRARQRELQDPESTSAQFIPPAMRQQQLEALKAEEEQLIALVKAQREVNDAKEKEAAPGKQAEFIRRQDRDAMTALTEKLKEGNKALTDLNKNAKETPEAFGSLTGTADQKIELLNDRAKILKESLKEITGLINRRPEAAGPLDANLAAQKTDQQRQLRETLAQIEAIKDAEKKADEAKRESKQAEKKAAAEVARLAKEAAREAEQDAQHYQQAIDKVTMSLAKEEEQALSTLQRMNAAYTQTKEASDTDKASALAARFPQNEAIQTEADLVKAKAKTREAYNAEVEALKNRFTAFKQNTDATREAEKAQEDYNQRLQDTLERLRTPKEERVSVAMRQKAPGGATTEEQDALLEEIRIQERLNYVASLFESMAGSVGQAWTGALLSVADGTKTVSDAFRDMARSIMQSLAQLAAQEGWKALIRLGVGLIAGGLTSGLSAGESPYGSDLGGMTTSNETIGRLTDLQMAIPHAGGGIINRPTFAMLGENPANNPEVVLNKHQMQQFMASTGRASPSAGGQATGGNVVVMNFPSKAAAEQEAGTQRSLGHQVVLNEVMADLGQGEGSRIMRSIRQQAR